MHLRFESILVKTVRPCTKISTKVLIHTRLRRYGPAEVDLAIGTTFGMPARFFEAYHHHVPPVEGLEMRMKVYK